MLGYDVDRSDAQKTVVVEARRKWSLAEKQAAIADAASSSISASARKHGVAASLLFRWRRDAAGANEKPDRTKAMGFVPVKVAPNVPALTHSPLRQSSTADARPDTTHGVIEIELVNGHKLRVSGSVDADVLKQVIAALDGGPVHKSTECEGG